jgi:HD-GYP domain-containing protein (c-di-GMP phosphodiesterase class II)
MQLDEAVAELKRSNGTQIDPRVVEVLIAPLDGYTETAAPPKIALAAIV